MLGVRLGRGGRGRSWCPQCPPFHQHLKDLYSGWLRVLSSPVLFPSLYPDRDPMGSLARVKGGRPGGAAPTTARTTKGAAPLTLPCKNTSQTATFAQMVLKLPSCRDVGRDCPFQDIIRLHSLAGRNLSVSQPVSRLCLSAVRLTARQGLAASSPQVNFILYFVFIFF